jgi:hypothetical protein
MRLNLALGLDELTFGMTKKEVISLIGIPDKTHIDEDDSNEIICDWNELKIRLTFYENESMKLGYIRIKNKDVTYNDQKIIGQSIDTVLSELFKEINEWEIEDYDFFKTYFNEKFWLIFRTDFNIIEEIEIGVPFKIENGNEYNWPK